jgi:methionyl-tRNA formyltransferase
VSSLKLIFAGTPDFSAIHLAALIESEHQLIAVYTQPDRPAGRGKKLQASPVKKLALEQGIPVYQPQSLRDPQEQACLAALGADVMVVVAYGLILPAEVLSAPAFGCLNVHASLLPRWRGAAPIQRAIEAGDNTSGTTVMQMDVGLDTGDMLATANCEIGPETTAAALHDKLASQGAPLLVKVLSDLERYQANATAQNDENANYASKILKGEAELDWTQAATTLDRAIRAFNPFPVCFTHLQGQRIKVWQAQAAGNAPLTEAAGTILRADRNGILVNCGEGQLNIQRLQLPGGKPLTADQVLNGSSELFTPGASFTLSGQAH